MRTLFFIFGTFLLLIQQAHAGQPYDGKQELVTESDIYRAIHVHDYSKQYKQVGDSPSNYRAIPPFSTENSFSYLQLINKKTQREIFKIPVCAFTTLWMSADSKYIVGLSTITHGHPIVIIHHSGKVLYNKSENELLRKEKALLIPKGIPKRLISIPMLHFQAAVEALKKNDPKARDLSHPIFKAKISEQRDSVVVNETFITDLRTWLLQPYFSIVYRDFRIRLRHPAEVGWRTSKDANGLRHVSFSKDEFAKAKIKYPYFADLNVDFSNEKDTVRVSQKSLALFIQKLQLPLIPIEKIFLKEFGNAIYRRRYHRMYSPSVSWYDDTVPNIQYIETDGKLTQLTIMDARQEPVRINLTTQE